MPADFFLANGCRTWYIPIMSGIFDIIYEDGDLVVVNKLAAVPVLPDKSGDSSLKDFLSDSRPGNP